MSLIDIRTMRLNRTKPKNFVTVVIGIAPAAYRGDSEVIELPAGCQPRLMDWRPVVGLWTAFYMVNLDWTVMDAAIDCASAAGAKLFGFVHAGKAHPLAIFNKLEDEKRAAYLMRAEWEALCN